MLYCFADHVALPSSFPGVLKTNLGRCRALTHTNRDARQQQQPKRDEWHSHPNGSLSMHVQVDGIEFNHRNDRPFFFLGHKAGDMNGLRRRGAGWLMPQISTERQGWSTFIIYMWAPALPRLVALFLNLTLFILFSTRSLFEGAFTSKLKEKRKRKKRVPIYHIMTFLSSLADYVVGWDARVTLQRDLVEM